MKQYVYIFKDEKEIFKGKIANIAIKDAYITKKSIELFDDEDPCIIHQSYVIKEYVDVLLDIFKKNDNKEIIVKDYLDDLDFLDYQDLDKIKIRLKG